MSLTRAIPIAFCWQAAMRRVSFKAKGWPWSAFWVCHHREQRHSQNTGAALAHLDRPADFCLMPGPGYYLQQGSLSILLQLLVTRGNLEFS